MSSKSRRHKSKKDDNCLEFSGSIKFVPPENLLLIEVYHLGAWVPLTIADGVKVCVPNIESAEQVLTQLRQVHIAKAIKIPLMRWRPLSKEEIQDIRNHLARHGQDKNFGTDIHNQRRIIKPGETVESGG